MDLARLELTGPAVPVVEAGDSREQSGIDAFRSLLGWPRRRGPDYNE
jgi:membrane protein required for beta-lactamase induction